MSGLARWGPRVAAALVGLFLLGLTLGSDPARLSRGQFFSDGATYYSMGWSLVEDFDFEYTAADLARVRREYPGGPTGVFLKRASGGLHLDPAPPWLSRVTEEDKRIYFGKAMTYPVLASPFVAIFGTRGFLLFNAICLLVAWACAFVEIRRRATEARALLASAALILATVAPLYIFWIQPELLNLALLSLALLAWRFDRPVLSAILFGIATYTKPTQILIAAPLGLSPWFAPGVPRAKRFLEMVRRGVFMVGCAVALFGVNTLVTGEWNYQGGERKTFSGEFPFERGASRDLTFGNSGEWMTTMKLGPLEEGEEATRGAGIVQAAVELEQMFRANLLDFWFGRYAGMLPYYGPAFVGLLVFLLMGPRPKEAWFAVSALLLFALVSIRILPGPTNWYGGGGTVGNRYFMAALPLAMLYLPKGRELLVAGLGTAVSLLFLVPAWVRPVEHSLRPALLASRPGTPITWLRAERAMLNDLSLCTDAWRKKQVYDNAEGEVAIHRPGSHHGYWLYFPDDGTYGREPIPGKTLPDGEPMEGFGVRRGEKTETLVRANEPVEWIDVTLFGSTLDDDVEIEAGGEVQRVLVPAMDSVSFRLVPGPHVMYYDSFVHSLKVRSHASPVAAPAGAAREPYTLVRLSLHVRPRQKS